MMDKNEFKKLGYEMIDWVAEYMDDKYDGPVQPKINPGEVLRILPQKPPLDSEPGADLFKDFKNIIVPNSTHWGDRRFFAYFPCTKSYPSVLAELLIAGLDINPFSWGTGPAATELEQRMMEWLGQMIGLNWSGVIQDTASTATLCAVLAARERVIGINQKGFSEVNKKLIAYTSEQAHSSVPKAVRIAGIGDDNLRPVPSNPKDFSVDTKALEEMILEDIEKGNYPFMVIANVGTTSSTAVDDVEKLSEICKKYTKILQEKHIKDLNNEKLSETVKPNNEILMPYIWLHVDAALAGTAAIVPEMQWLMQGVDKADSFVFNPHKWMFTNLECSAFFVKEPIYLKKAMSIQPEYLKMDNDGKVENYRDWIVQLGRRFKALKLWFVIRSFGVNGLIEKIRLHLKMTQKFADFIKSHPDLNLVVGPKINTVCFRVKDSDEATKKLMDELNASGEAFLTHTKLGGQFVLRAAFGQTNAELSDVDNLSNLILKFLPQKSSALI